MEKPPGAGRPSLTGRLSRLRHDLVAGLTVASVAVPQAMAYALIAGIEPVYGLYTAIVMTTIASVLGSSSHLINGPTNAISLVVFSAAAGLSMGPDDPERIQVVGLLALLVGAIQILIALLRLGDLTRYVSESVVLGFMAGAGALVALTQVQNLFGLEARGSAHDHLLWRLWLTWTEGGPVNTTALMVGLATLLLIFLLHRLSRTLRTRLPELLLSLVLVSLVVWLLKPAANDAAPGHLHIERRLPALAVPPVRADWIRQIWGASLAIALLGLMEALSIAKAVAVQSREALDYNRQCLAEGVANLGAGLFRCMPGSGSLTRTAINFHAGGRTRWSGVFSAAAVAAALVAFAPLADFVPQAALAGVLLWTAGRIVDRRRLVDCVRASRFDAVMALATAATVFLSIEFSVIVGTFVSFLLFLPRTARLEVTELAVGLEASVHARGPKDPACNRLALFSLEGELFFGVTPELDALFTQLADRVHDGVRVVVLHLKRARHPDLACMDRFRHFILEMQARGAEVLLCGVREDFAAALANLQCYDWLPRERVFRATPVAGSSTRDAVRRAYELLGSDRCAACPWSAGAAEAQEALG
jgi:SulP family sulfate permease